jgi:NAD(P)-dependent dehydrogenase (short-subunit alcohol dehydrogenase family)
VYTFFMAKGILIAGNESSLFTALCRGAAKRADAFASAPIPAGIKTEQPPAPGIVVDWNPSSPISARTLVLEGLNRMEQIDEAVLVCVPPAYRRLPHELSPAELDRMIDFNIKGWFFLVKEICSVFESRGKGTLALVLSELAAAEDTPDLLGPVAISAFRAFAQSIVLSLLAVPYNAMGFSSAEAGEEEAFAAFVFKTIDDGKKSAGKWHKYGKFGLFRR